MTVPQTILIDSLGLQAIAAPTRGSDRLLAAVASEPDAWPVEMQSMDSYDGASTERERLEGLIH